MISIRSLLPWRNVGQNIEAISEGLSKSFDRAVLWMNDIKEMTPSTNAEFLGEWRTELGFNNSVSASTLSFFYSSTEPTLPEISKKLRSVFPRVKIERMKTLLEANDAGEAVCGVAECYKISAELLEVEAVAGIRFHAGEGVCGLVDCTSSAFTGVIKNQTLKVSGVILLGEIDLLKRTVRRLMPAELEIEYEIKEE